LFIEPECLELQTVMRAMVEVAQRVTQHQVLPVLAMLARRFSQRGYLQVIAKQEVIVERRGRSLVKITAWRDLLAQRKGNLVFKYFDPINSQRSLFVLLQIQQQ
jgi:hypothetical protein